MVWEILYIFIVLGAILGITYLVLFFIRKHFFAFDNRKSKGLRLHVLGTKVIAPKKYVTVIQFLDKVLLIGITDQSITLLEKVDDLPELPDAVTEFNDNIPTSFMTLLKRNMGIRS